MSKLASWLWQCVVEDERRNYVGLKSLTLMIASSYSMVLCIKVTRLKPRDEAEER